MSKHTYTDLCAHTGARAPTQANSTSSFLYVVLEVESGVVSPGLHECQEWSTRHLSEADRSLSKHSLPQKRGAFDRKQTRRRVLATHARMWSAHWLRCGNHHQGKQRGRSLPEEATAACSPAHHNSRWGEGREQQRSTGKFAVPINRIICIYPFHLAG